MKKFFEMFDLINVKDYQERIENISLYVNPDKTVKKKKKIDKDKEKDSKNNVENNEK